MYRTRDLRPLSLDGLLLETSGTDLDTMTDPVTRTAEVATKTVDRGMTTVTMTDRGMTIVDEMTDDTMTDLGTTTAEGTIVTLTDETTEVDETMKGEMTEGRSDETIGLMTVGRVGAEMTASEARLPGRGPKTARRTPMVGFRQSMAKADCHSQGALEKVDS